MKIERSKNPALFFSEKEKEQIIEAIEKSEINTSGEIRIHLERKARGDFFGHAKETFEKIGMAKTKERNGTLIFIGVASKRFAVLGDIGIHEKVPVDFWDDIVSVMKKHFMEDRFADGISEAVVLIGAKLKEFFPYMEDDINELSDEISYSF